MPPSKSTKSCISSISRSLQHSLSRYLSSLKRLSSVSSTFHRDPFYRELDEERRVFLRQVSVHIDDKKWARKARQLAKSIKGGPSDFESIQDQVYAEVLQSFLFALSFSDWRHGYDTRIRIQGRPSQSRWIVEQLAGGASTSESLRAPP
jgi:hypothetical protein